MQELSPVRPSATSRTAAHPVSLSFTISRSLLKFIFIESMMLSNHLILCRRRQWQPTPVLLPGKSDGQRSLVGYSPWGCKESDTAEQLHLHCIVMACGSTLVAMGVSDICFSLSVVLVCRLLSSCGGGGDGGAPL